MTPPTIHISIIVYKGSPLDYSHYRHTALWLRSSDRSPPVLAHIIGSHGLFEFESKESANPSATQRFAKCVDVGFLTIAASAEQTVQALRRLPIDNTDREFNCQTWIERALKSFKDYGHLSDKSYQKGVDGMVEAIAEAEDTEG